MKRYSILIFLSLALMAAGCGSSGSGQVYGDKDCPDFDTHAEAQRFFENEGGPDSDPHRLDRDNDGIACETLP